MRDRIRLNRSGKKKANTSVIWVLAIVGLAGGVLLIAGIVAVVVMANNGQLNLPGGGLAGLGANPKVNVFSYGSLYSGQTLSEVEGVMGGGGRAATKADLDAVCGSEVERYTNPFFTERGRWEANNSNGLVRVWSNGKVLIVCVFNQSGSGGQLIQKVMKDENGAVNSEAGLFGSPPMNLPNQRQGPGQNNSQPGQGQVVNPVAPTWQQLVGTWEAVNHPGMRYRFTPNQEIGVHFGGPGKEQVYPVIRTTTANGFFTPTVVLGTPETRQIEKDMFGSFWFENGTLYCGYKEAPASTKMALRKVN